jgi:hypothetical protein
VFARKEQCVALSRNFNRVADEVKGNDLKAARYPELARQYEREAEAFGSSH